MARQWYFGLRGDYVEDPEEDPKAITRAVSPFVTLTLSEFNRFRLQLDQEHTPEHHTNYSGYLAGEDCDAVIETLRGPDLGGVLWRGSAAPDTRIPGDVGGETEQRVLRAPAAGRLRLRAAIGERVEAGALVVEVEGRPVASAIAGLVRGLLADGDRVEAGQKLGDIDPRPDAPPADRITDKSRRVGSGVLTALVEGLRVELPGGPPHSVDGESPGC